MATNDEKKPQAHGRWFFTGVAWILVLCGGLLYRHWFYADLNSSNPDRRQSAINLETNQAVLAAVAIGDKDWLVGKAALDKITNQSLLGRISVAAGNSYIRETAFERLNDQSVLTRAILTRIATNKAADLFSRMSATRRLTDQAALATVALQALTSSGPIPAYKSHRPDMKAIHERVRLEIAAQEDSLVWTSAINRLTNETVLGNLATNAPDPSVRDAAAKRLHPPSQTRS